MKPWITLGEGKAPDGEPMVLKRRGHEFLIYAGGYDLMSSEDDVSSIALAKLGCAHLVTAPKPKVLVGGLGMGFTLRAALDVLKSHAVVEVAELVEAVVDWNREHLGELCDHPLRDPRTVLRQDDVLTVIGRARGDYAAIMLDVDNGPDALAHSQNNRLYSTKGIAACASALAPKGVLSVWSFDDDPGYTKRLCKAGFTVETHKVSASRKGRGRYHQVWTARRG